MRHMDLSKQQQIRRTRNVREGLGIEYAINGYHEVLETHRRVLFFVFCFTLTNALLLGYGVSFYAVSGGG